METSPSTRTMMSRCTNSTVVFLQFSLMLAGLILVVGLANILLGNAYVIDTVRSLATDLSARPEPVPTNDNGEAVLRNLSPRMRVALDYVAHRYRVSSEALAPIFAAAQQAGQNQGLDPLLIIAVIGIESRFNPISESTMGAQGLMQVIPRFHMDKLPEGAGSLPFFNPVTNVQVGAQALKEAIRRNGGLVSGLQQFAGATDDEEQTYANKVLAEKQRLDQAVARPGMSTLI